MNNFKLSFLAIFTFFLAVVNAQSKVDTINSSNNELLTSKLTEFSKEYLVYRADSTKSRKNIGDIWKREAKFSKFNNKEAVEFTWKWFTKDGALYKTVTNICDRKTLAPLHHLAVTNKIGDPRYDRSAGTKSFGYSKDEMYPDKNVADNSVLGSNPVKLNIPILSWEIDLETLPLLPIKKVGQKFAVSFFDPSEKEAGYHLYEVTGKGKLKLNNDTQINCWLLKINYDEKNYALFWLSEKSGEVIKMEEQYNSVFRFKVLQY
ncbi:MAG: hypothetical protein FD122_2872 [Stygiobacter sp.]|nr:MAG: hypothetical protein FD122_2872 [Stygiobacter sp.]